MARVDKKRAQEPIDFIQHLHLVGDFTGRPFTLQPWQQEVLSQLYGTIKDDGRRQYEYLYLEVPKKNGKTPLVAALGLYHLVCDPPGGEIYCAAAEKEQAGQTYRYMKSMIEQDAFLNRALRVVDSKKEIHNPETGTFVKVLSAEAYSKHGMTPSVVIIDELHAHQKRDLWDYLTFGTGSARREPLWLTITTAGDDPDRHSIGWEVHEYARQVRDGELVDPTWCVYIYAAPEDADIYDEAVWFAANPSLGVAIDIDAVRQEALRARNSEAAERLFRWLRLNQWVSLKRTGWLPITLWDTTTRHWSAADMLRKRCYVGIDLSSTTDLTAAAVLFPPQEGKDEWRFIFDAWVPEDNMRERAQRDKVPYEEWARDGYLKATPGNVIDYAYVRNHIEKLALDYNVQWFCADRWQLEILKQLLPRGIQRKFIEIGQNMEGMSSSMKELERLFRSGCITHPPQPLGRWAFGNVVLAVDGNENIKPMKNRSLERIDPIVALIDAMAGAIKLEPKGSSNAYEKGIRMA